MDLARIISLARWEISLFLYGLAAILAVKLLTGQVNSGYLLYGRRRDGTLYFSPERVQMLVATLAVAMQYVALARQAPPGVMPDLPVASLQVLGLSHAVYLGGKSFAAFRKITAQKTPE